MSLFIPSLPLVPPWLTGSAKACVAHRREYGASRSVPHQTTLKGLQDPGPWTCLWPTTYASICTYLEEQGTRSGSTSSPQDGPTVNSLLPNWCWDRHMEVCTDPALINQGDCCAWIRQRWNGRCLKGLSCLACHLRATCAIKPIDCQKDTQDRSLQEMSIY